MAERDPTESEEAAPERPASTSVVDESPDALFARAQRRLAEGETLEALALLERVHRCAPDNAHYASWLGVLLAHERGQVKRGVELCGSALAQDTSYPEHYYHLAKVHLRAGEKATAIGVLRDGMRVHPESEQLSGALVSLGIRKPPPFGALERSHPINKYTGLLLTRLGLR